jgi:hypothetical protein
MIHLSLVLVSTLFMRFNFRLSSYETIQKFSLQYQIKSFMDLGPKSQDGYPLNGLKGIFAWLLLIFHAMAIEGATRKGHHSKLI